MAHGQLQGKASAGKVLLPSAHVAGLGLPSSITGCAGVPRRERFFCSGQRSAISGQRGSLFAESCLLIAVCLLLATGCAGLPAKPQAGGKGRIPVATSQPHQPPAQQPGPGAILPAPASVASQDIEQPENPAQSASQTRKEEERVELPLPAGSRVTSGQLSAVSGQRPGQPVNSQLPNSQLAAGVSVELSAPSTLKIERTTESGQRIGAAQKDDSREITAKLASFKSVQWLGALLLLASLAMFHPVVRAVTQSGTLQMVTGATGLVLVFAPAVVVGNEQTFLFLGVGLPLLWFFVHRHGKLQGFVDANRDGIDDRLQQRGTRNAERGNPPLNPATP